MERKHIDVGFQVKAVSDDGMIEGYGSVFGVRDSYSDIVAPGAFKASLAAHKAAGTMPALLWQHRADEPIGVWKSMEEDDRGLACTGQLAMETVRGREAHALLKMGALTGLSIGYVTKQSERGTRPDEPRRTLKKLDLLEISLVTFPANPRARVESVKGITRREIERMLTQDAGLSRSQAREILARRFGPAMQDAGPDPADALRRLITIIQP